MQGEKSDIYLKLEQRKKKKNWRISNTMRKKLYNAAYFMLNNNESFGHSFGIRLKVVGLNAWIVCYALSRYYFSNLRIKSAKDERFDWRCHKITIQLYHFKDYLYNSASFEEQCCFTAYILVMPYLFNIMNLSRVIYLPIVIRNIARSSKKQFLSLVLSLSWCIWTLFKNDIKGFGFHV